MLEALPVCLRFLLLLLWGQVRNPAFMSHGLVHPCGFPFPVEKTRWPIGVPCPQFSRAVGCWPQRTFSLPAKPPGGNQAEISNEFWLAFEDVSANFSQLFAKLFPGGVGKLHLTEPENLLETGVEILAQPFDKKVSRLSLLSGGERSLVALASALAIKHWLQITAYPAP